MLRTGARPVCQISSHWAMPPGTHKTGMEHLHFTGLFEVFLLLPVCTHMHGCACTLAVAEGPPKVRESVSQGVRDTPSPFHDPAQSPLSIENGLGCVPWDEVLPLSCGQKSHLEQKEKPSWTAGDASSAEPSEMRMHSRGS